MTIAERTAQITILMPVIMMAFVIDQARQQHEQFHRFMN